MDVDTLTGVAIMNKCTFCYDRVTNGEQPACAAACTTGAITYGNRTDLLAQAKERVNTLNQNNVQASLYGVNELGLHVLYVLDDSPDVYRLPTDPEVPPSSTVRNILSWVGSGLAIAILAGFGLNYIVARLRMKSGEK